MKNLLKISLFAFLAIGLFSCEEENDELTGNGKAGGLLEKVTSSVSYAKEDLSLVMNSQFSAYQGTKQIKSVSIYNQYTGKINVGTPTEAMAKSNNVLMRTVDFALNNQYETINFNYKYENLAAGIVFNGAPMSTTSDAALKIGDFWTLSYVANFVDGSTSHLNVPTTKITVSCGSNLAATYNLVVSITAGNGAGTNYTMPGEVVTFMSGTRYKASSIGPYNSRGLIAAGAQISGVGLVFDDLCAKESFGSIQLWKDADWSAPVDTGVTAGNAQYLGPYYNPVYQTAAQIATSKVDPVTGVITIHYNIWFAAGVRSYKNVYTPQ